MLLARVFIPSRDRAMQLDGTLRSLTRQCADLDRAQISVLFRATSRDHKRAYELVAEEHRGVRMHEERDFARDARRLLASERYRRFSSWRRPTAKARVPAQIVAVDDTMFVDRFDLESMVSALENTPNALGFSLRLGETIRWCHPLELDTPRPPLERVDENGDIVSFLWTTQIGDWGYPFDLSSSVYRHAEFAQFVRAIQFDSPTLLEDQLWTNRTKLATQVRLMCYRRPKALSLAVNRVQDIAPNPTSALERHDVSALLAQFLEGWRMDVGAYDGYLPHACHEEAELILARPKRLSAGA